VIRFGTGAVAGVGLESPELASETVVIFAGCFPRVVVIELESYRVKQIDVNDRERKATIS
jgi:hypothetical protein